MLLVGIAAEASTKNSCIVSYALLEDQTDAIFYYQVAKYDNAANDYITIFQQTCEDQDGLSKVVEDNCDYIQFDNVGVRSTKDGLKISLSCG